jgi:hypothetical protein
MSEACEGQNFLVRPISENPSPETYAAWLLREHNVNVRKQEAYYNLLGPSLKDSFERSSLWQAILKSIDTINDDYKRQTGEDLFATRAPNIVVKPFGSFLSKTYRKNIKNNERFPSQPEGGWLLPPDWYSGIPDLVRTTFVVRYLDGVQFLGDRIVRIGARKRIHIDLQRQSTSMGYYAIHLDYPLRVEVADADMQTRKDDYHLEIQITTEVKQALKGILHSFYESARGSRPVDNKEWSWDLKGDEFVANNLGHMLHYIEGMIVRLRDEQRGIS